MDKNPFSLQGKKVLVTGASSGIGRQTAISVSRQGGVLVLTARREDELKHTLGLLSGSGHEIIVADQTVKEQREHLINSVQQLDGIVFCAGKIDPFPIKFLTEEKITSLMDVNFTSTALLAGGLIRSKKIEANASLVFISSYGAHQTYKGGAVYASSKLALEGFSKVLSQETDPLKIRVNCLSPAMVKTDVYDEASKQLSDEIMNAHIDRYPLGVGYPEDVANAAVFLLSPASRWITGQNIILDGGLSVGL